MKKTKIGDLTFDLVNTLYMLVLLMLMLYPFVYVLMYSFSDPSLVYGKLLFYPLGFSLDSYLQCFVTPNVIHGALISIARSLIGPLATIIVIFSGAYALSKKKLVARKFFSRFVIFTMYFNAGIIPMYILMVTLGLKGTFFVYILPYLPSIFLMILIRTYLENLPVELEESAYLDGANDFTIAFKVYLPLCLPIVAAVALFECVNQWNYFQDTLFYNAEISKNHTLQYVMVTFIQNSPQSLESAEGGGGNNFTSTSLRMAMTVITIVPIALVYPFLQKYFVKGLMIGSIKG